MEACKALKLKKGLIITLDEEQEAKKDEIEITVLPAWKWLLEK
jgi:predicted AAA+ superfamily ATPase